MNVKLSENTREYSFRVPLTEAEANRFENYIGETGLKKTAFVRKAILFYLDCQEEEAVRE